jgi:hypothetical protein
VDDRDSFLGVTYGWHEQYLGDDRGYWNGIIVPNLRELGARMVRVEVKCNAHLPAPARAQGAPASAMNYAGIYDHVVRHMNENGIAVLALIDYMTTDASMCGINAPADRPDGTNPYIRDLAAAAGEFARHYSGAAGGAGNIAGVEVWNEPNACFPLWNSCGRSPQYAQVHPDRYAALLTAIATTVRAVSPDIAIVAGALLSDTSGAPEKRPTAYLRATARSARRGPDGRWPWDAIGLHPYVDPPALPGELAEVEDALRALGAPPRVWITEMGYSLCRGANTPQQQADKLGAAVAAARASRAVERFLWFTFHDWGDGSCADPGQMMGLCTVGPDQRIRERRPAWHTYQGLAAQ